MSLTIWQVDPAQMTPYYNIALCDALGQAGCDVHYMTSQYLYDLDLPPQQNFTTDYVYFRGLNHPWLLNYPRLRRLLRAAFYPFGHYQVLRNARRHPPDIFHMQWSRLPRLDEWLLKQVQRMRIPVVHTVHDVVPLFAQDASTTALGRIFAMADALVVHTRANANSLIETYPHLAPAKLHLIPLINAENATMPSEANQVEARRQLGLPVDVPVALFFGSIRDYKGLDILAEALPQVADLCPDLRVVIAGRPETARHRELLAQLAQLPHVFTHSGFIPSGDVWKYHLAADVILFPYRHIYQSAALITAMSFGRAVIVTNVGGLPETVDGNGWIVPANDAPALARVIAEAVADRERLREMGERSLELVRRNHSGAQVAQQMIDLYRGLFDPQTSDSVNSGS